MGGPNDLAENRPQLLMASYAAMPKFKSSSLLAVTSRKRMPTPRFSASLPQSAQQVVRQPVA